MYRNKEELEPLARMLGLAYVAYTMGTTFETARRNYATQPIGEYWYSIADLVLRNPPGANLLVFHDSSD